MQILKIPKLLNETETNSAVFQGVAEAVHILKTQV